MRLTTEQLSFMARFARSPEGQFFAKMLEQRQAELNSKLRDATGEEIYRTQGRAKEVDELIIQINSAQQTLNRNELPVRTRLSA